MVKINRKPGSYQKCYLAHFNVLHSEMWNCLRSVETLLKDIVQGKTSSPEMNQHLSLEDKECERLCNPNSGCHSTGAPEIQSEGSRPKADDGEVLLLHEFNI